MRSRLLTASLFCCLCSAILAAQGSVPGIYPGGTVSAASLFPVGAPNYGAAPGSIVSIFGTNLALSVAQAGSIPLKTTLIGTSVTIGGIAAPLFYVSPGQINAQVPYDVATGAQPVIVKTAAGASTAQPVPVHSTQPAIFSVNQNGMGQAAVQNVIVNGSNVTYVNNGATVAVSPGNLLVVYGTGAGVLTSGPANGSACTGQQLASGTYSATIGGVQAGIQFAGCSPGYVGLDQWNIVIPSTIPDGCYLPLQVSVGGVVSNVVTVAVSKTGNCSSAATGLPTFPAGQSFGALVMGRVLITVPGLGTFTTSQFLAFFNQLAASSTPSSGGFPPAGGGCLTEVYSNGASSCNGPGCSPPTVGFSNYSGATPLDAGPMTITSPAGTTTSVPQVATGNYRLNASPTADALNIVAGNWTVNASGAPRIGAFAAHLAIAGFLSNVTFGTAGSFSASSPLTLTWTCPDPTLEVVASISSPNSNTGIYGGAVCAAACSAGTITVPSSVLKQLPASDSSGANIELMLIPSTASSQKFTASGLNVGYFFLVDTAYAANLTLTP